MRAGYFPELGVAEFRSDMPEPQIRYDKDVKIRIRKCGICGSEVHALHGMHPFRIPPVLSGHEFAGDVVEVGKGVTKFKPGDRVTGEPQYGCGECYYCKHGMYNLCTSKRVLGASYKVPELDNGEWTGSMGEYIVVPEKTVVKLADNVSYEEGALIEPIANGIYAVRRANITPESTVAIIGCGPIGLGDLIGAQLYGPKLIVAADVSEINLKMAREFGCKNVVDSSKQDLEEVISELTDGVGVDMVFLGFGNEAVLEQACRIVRRGGTVHQHALMLDGIGFPYRIHQQHELSFKAYNMYKYEEFELICDEIARGRISGIERMVTHRYPIEEFKQAMEMADKRPEPVVKVMLDF